jgi:hypothetical protein
MACMEKALECKGLFKVSESESLEAWNLYPWGNGAHQNRANGPKNDTDNGQAYGTSRSGSEDEDAASSSGTGYGG